VQRDIDLIRSAGLLRKLITRKSFAMMGHRVFLAVLAAISDLTPWDRYRLLMLPALRTATACKVRNRNILATANSRVIFSAWPVRPAKTTVVGKIPDTSTPASGTRAEMYQRPIQMLIPMITWIVSHLGIPDCSPSS
jgi:hypothetical protein